MDTRLKAARAAHKGVMTKHMKKFEEIQQDSELDKDKILTLLETIKLKKTILVELNGKILEQTSEEDYAEELQESDEYMFDLDYKIRQITNLAESCQITSSHRLPATSLTTKPLASESTLINPQADSFIPPTMHVQTTVEPSFNYQSNPPTNVPNTRSSYTSSTQSDYHKLPKLSLPSFEGDILDWQSFWDSYETAIHTNPTLSDSQKFNYLKSLVRNEALQTISGFSMTNTNYTKAIALLQERYGQVHKIKQTYMQALLDIPAPIYSFASLRTYYDKTETYVRGLESLGQTDETYGSLLVPVILNKLPAEIRQNLAREHRSTDWSLSDLRKSILDELIIMEAGKLPEKLGSPHATAAFLTNAKVKSKPSYYKNSNKSVSDQHRKPVPEFYRKTKNCIFCNESGHIAVNCTKVTSHEARMKIVKRDRRCFNCLGNHKLADCKSTSNCRKCNKRHHTSLCGNMSNETRNGDESSTPENTEVGERVLHSSLTQRASNVILKTAIASVKSGNQTTEANILLDEGAQRSFITDALANKLNISSNRTEVVHLSGFGEQTRQVRHLRSATVYIETDDGSRTNIPLDVLIVPEIALPIKNHISSVAQMKHLRGLKLAHPVSEDDMFEVNLLIGADYYWSIVGDRIVRGDGPTAVESKLGYLLSGPTLSNKSTCSWNSMLNVMVTHKTDEYNLEKFWEVESLGVGEKTENTEFEKFQENYEESSISFHDNRYFAKLPFKMEHAPLPVNKSIAIRRTENVIKRLSKEPQLLHKYGEIINEQEKRGFIEKVNPEVKPQEKLHYIPHHPVKKDSTTTPIRIVYDCSCKPTQDSTSLNECLLNVPPKLNDVTAILMRFRMNRFAVSTDIEKAFLNIGLEEEDRDVTRFFWLSNPTDPNSELTTYRFKSVLFGATCSPFILNAVLIKHLNDNRCEITEKLSKDLYVDNIVSSFNSEEELLDYFRISRKLFADGGFNLRAWASNNRLLQELAASENVFDKDQLIKVLGMRWDTVKDTLGYGKCDLSETQELITKREVLKQSSRIYDPLGIISPVTVRSKMLMQQVWESKVNWDEILPNSLVTEWLEIINDIQEATKTTIPRHYYEHSSDTNRDIVLHIFTDASMKAYGACAYIISNGQSSLVMAKNRVAP